MLERKRRFANAEKAVLEVRIGGMKFCGAFGISRGLCTGRPTRTRVAPPQPLNHIQHFPDSCSRFFATLFLHTTPDCVGGCSLPSTPSSSPFTSSPLPSLSILFSTVWQMFKIDCCCISGRALRVRKLLAPHPQRGARAAQFKSEWAAGRLTALLRLPL